MNPFCHNRFEDFFADGGYVRLKNHLYNYLLRKRAVCRCLTGLAKGHILEVGSGLSPMVTDSGRVVYSELSFPALRILRKDQPKGRFVVADATRLPFKPNGFAVVVCSEVLEHLQDDQQALRQMAEVMKPGGSLILTFPHRRFYFARDDRFVHHFRRYELSEMEKLLQEAGLHPMAIWKVLGPTEKLIMLLVTTVISFQPRFAGQKIEKVRSREPMPILGLIFNWLNRLLCLPIRLEARVVPRCLASVLLIRAQKALSGEKR